MEPYRVTGLPNSGLQRGYTQPSRLSRAQANGAGKYGLSIRVQGIGGHPYVVLNNQEKAPQSLIDPNSNGHVDTQDSFIDNYDEYDFRADRESGSHSPFIEYRSKKMTRSTDTLNGTGESKAKRSSTVLNFQRHPEILQPYDPENNSLDGFRSLPTHPVRSLVESQPAVKRSSPNSTLPKPSSQDQSRTQLSLFPSLTETAPSHAHAKAPLAPLAPPQARPQTQPQTQVVSQPEPQPPPQAGPPPTLVSQHHPRGSSPSSVSPSAPSSGGSSLERPRLQPDILPLRRTDSSGPVLQASSRSRHSSASSSSTAKNLHDDQMEALYGDAINRHQNRRYIPFLPGSGRDIDTGSIPAVDELIEKFDGSDGNHPRRGRAGRRNRINAEDRKRSRSVDSALPFGLRQGSSYMDEFSKQQGTSREHVLRPSQLRLQKAAGGQDSWVTAVDGKISPRASGSPEATGGGSLRAYRKPLARSSTLPLEREEEASSEGKVNASCVTLSAARASASTGKTAGKDTEALVTPDLLKGQQELSQQTHEETAKQILFNYLKDGSNDNDDTTKRKVNLVFEKIQTLKSRATGTAQGDGKSLDLAAQTKALQEQKAEQEKEIVNLKKQLEEHSKKNQILSNEKTRLKEQQQEVEWIKEECSRLQEKLTKAEADLQSTLEELFQVKMEREQHQTEIRDLQEQLSEMHDELDAAKKSAADAERDSIMADLNELKVELQDIILAKEELEEILRRRERELTALKGALKQEVATHDQELDKLREQYEEEIHKLQSDLEERKQNSAAVIREKAEVEAAKGAVEGQAGRLAQEAERLRRRAQELENEVAKLNRIIDEAKLQENRLGDRVRRLEKDKKHLEESLSEIKEQDEEMSRANRALTARLEDVQRNLAKLSKEHVDLEERLKEEKIQKEQFKNTKNEIEGERRLLDRTIEKLQKEMNEIAEASQSSTQELQEQIDIYREKNRRELAELQRQLKERGQELEKHCLAAKTLQAQLSKRDEELQDCRRERDEAVLKEKSLEQKLSDLEMEVKAHVHTKDDKSRHIKMLEDRIVQLELDLEEERQSGDQLMDRIDRGREQVEQMRNELLQERAGRQDLECDKMALERQNKDLKSRVSHLEGSQKSNKEGQVAQLESRIQELEERLEGEERERASLQGVNRKLERKVKEMMMQVDEEQNSMQDQKDQLNLRLKALKRQMDEAEEEIDRLEHGKKKLQRDLDDQQEANEQLQSQLKALRNEMRRKSSSAPLLNNLDDDDDDDDISTDGETYFSSSGYKRSTSQDNMISTFSLN